MTGRHRAAAIIGGYAAVWLAAVVVLNLHSDEWAVDSGYWSNGWPWTILIRDRAFGYAAIRTSVWLSAGFEAIYIFRWPALACDILFAVAGGIAIAAWADKMIVRRNWQIRTADLIAITIVIAGLCLPYDLRRDHYVLANGLFISATLLWLAHGAVKDDLWFHRATERTLRLTKRALALIKMDS